MMKRFLLLLFIPILLSEGAIGKETMIEGKAPDYKGEKAELVGVTDHLTQMDSILDRGKVSAEDGSFRLRVDHSRIRPAWVRIGNAKAKIYLEPGRDYEVKFPKIPDDRIERMHGHTEVEMTFYELPEHDANNLVIDFNQVYEGFFARNYQALGVRYASGGSYMRERGKLGEERDSLTKEKIKNTPKISHLADSLKKILEERYQEVQKPWFRVHYEHAMASLYRLGNLSKGESYERYFQNEKVRPHHEEYMKHFLNFYDQHLIKFARRHDSILNLKRVLRYEKDPAPILKALESDEAEYMDRKALRELVLIDGMFDAFYHQKNFDKEGIHAVLDSMASKASQKGIREQAHFLSEFLSQRQAGSKAPGFRLIDRDTNSVSLRGLKGAPVYMNFWATWNETSLKHLRMIKKLHESYGDEVRFVSICTDENLRAMQEFLEKHPKYDWTFLHAGSEKNLTESYQVASIPAYYLLDEEGRFITLPAPKPGENARKMIHSISKKILREKKRRRKSRRGWNH